MCEDKQTDWSIEQLDLCHRFQDIVEKCPHCGQKAMIFLGPFKAGRPYVQCVGDDGRNDNCWATVSGNCLTDALTKWNKRVPMDELKKKLAKLQSDFSNNMSDIFKSTMQYAIIE